MIYDIGAPTQIPGNSRTRLWPRPRCEVHLRCLHNGRACGKKLPWYNKRLPGLAHTTPYPVSYQIYLRLIQRLNFFPFPQTPTTRPSYVPLPCPTSPSRSKTPLHCSFSPTNGLLALLKMIPPWSSESDSVQLLGNTPLIQCTGTLMRATRLPTPTRRACS